MIKYFTSLDIVFFYITAVLQASLVVVLFVKGIFRRFPSFTLLSCFWFINNIALYAQAFWLSPQDYAYRYFVGVLVGLSIMVFVIWFEIYLKTFGPPSSLPHWVTRQVIVCLALVYTSFALSSGFLQARQKIRLISALYATERMAIGGLAAALLVLIAYSFIKLKVQWRPHVLSVAGGLCFYMTIELAAAYSRYWLPSEIQSIARLIPSIAYSIVLMSWNFSFLAIRDVGPSKIDPVDVEMLFRNHRTSEIAAASWGLKTSISTEGGK